MTESWPVTLWHSTLGVGDGHDYATRGYLTALMKAGYEGIRIPPSVTSSLMRFDATADPDILKFRELAQPPKHLRMKPLERIKAGDPRIKAREIGVDVEGNPVTENVGEQVIKGTDEFGNEVETEIKLCEGSVDLDKEQQYTSYEKLAVECVVIHHDPASISRNYTNFTKTKRPEGVAYVGITVWEADSIPNPVARILSELECIVVPSEHTRSAFMRSGVDTKVVVVPHTFDPEVWSRPKMGELRKPGGKYVFYGIGTPIERKNLGTLMRAYFTAFEGRDDVVLRLKSTGEHAALIALAKKALEESGIAAQQRPAMRLYTDHWETDKMRAFHLDGDCFVSATRGEGFGLCLGAGTLVTTRSGVRPIDKIVAGEEVLSHDGQWHCVRGCSKRTVYETYRIVAAGCPELIATAEHPILAARRPAGVRFSDFVSQANPDWVNASEVTEDDYVVLRGPCEAETEVPFLQLVDYTDDPIIEDDRFASRYSNDGGAGITAEAAACKIGVSVGLFRHAVQPSHRCKTSEGEQKHEEIREAAKALGYFEAKRWLPCSIPWSERWCELVGYYAGDGSIGAGGNCVEFSLNDTTKSHAALELQDFLRGIGLKSAIEDDPDSHRLRLTCSSSVLSSVLFSLCGKRARDKRLPSLVFTLPRPMRVALLRGLMGSDGSDRGSMLSYSSVSPVLAWQVRDLWMSLGFPCAVRPYRGSSCSYWQAAVAGKFVPVARQMLGLPDVQDRTLTSRRGSHYVDFEDTWLARVKDVDVVRGEQVVYNLQIDETETFVASGFVVHNCEFEAKLCASRVITTDWGSAPEFLRLPEVAHKTHSYGGGPYRGGGAVFTPAQQTDLLVPSKLISVDGMFGVGCYDPKQKWADPEFDHLVEAMRTAARQRLSPDVEGWDRLYSTHSPEVVGAQLADALMQARREAKEDDDDDFWTEETATAD